MNYFNHLQSLAIQHPSPAHAKRAQHNLNQLTKPTGSLGELENILVQLCAIQQTTTPSASNVHIALFVADHGLAVHNVSAYPQAVTAKMIHNFCTGGAAISVLAKKINASLEVINLGTAHPSKHLKHSNLIHAIVAPGTHDACAQNSMNSQQLSQCLWTGMQAAQRAHQQGCELFIGGEMGISNTTCASALGCLLLNKTPETMTGTGTGINAERKAHKIQVIQRIVQRHTGVSDLHNLLCGAGGFEILALAGAYLQAAFLRIPVIVDGFISIVGALIATRINQNVQPFLIFSHASTEVGYAVVAKALDAQPILHANMRLGEGTGAALLVDILQSAVALFNQMSTFQEANIDKRTL